MPPMCFVLLASVSQRIFGKPLTCTMLMRPAPVSSWKAVLFAWSGPKYCYQATIRPVPVENGVVYTLSGSMSQQHCVTPLPHGVKLELSSFRRLPTCLISSYHSFSCCLSSTPAVCTVLTSVQLNSKDFSENSMPIELFMSALSVLVCGSSSS